MFHQVVIREEDRDSQRFLWPSNDNTMQAFEMKVMTFGATCSPATAQYIKNKNANEFYETHPAATKCILENHYVDDMLASCDTQEEATQLAQDVRRIHSKAGFHIRGWKSNSAYVVQQLDGTDSEVNLDLESENEKVLGIWWSPAKDRLTYSLKYAKICSDLLNDIRKPTKREVLSLLMSIYDPNGHLSHFTLQLKIILQDSWRDGQDWNQQINDKQYSMWQHWLRRLPEIEEIEIPRCYLNSIDNYTNAEVQLHTFVDAGREVYAAVAFLRITKDGRIDVTQVGAKVKVAPLAPNTVPRLELQAALVGARYAQHIKQCLSIDIHSTYFLDRLNHSTRMAKK